MTSEKHEDDHEDDKEDEGEHEDLWGRLAKPRVRNMTEKYVPGKRDVWQSGVAPGALVGRIPERIHQLAVPPVRIKGQDGAARPGDRLQSKAPDPQRLNHLAVPKEYVLIATLNQYENVSPNLGVKLKKAQDLSHRRKYVLHRCKEKVESRIIVKSEMYAKNYHPPKVSAKKRQKELTKWTEMRSQPRKEPHLPDDALSAPKPPPTKAAVKALEKHLRVLAQPMPKNITPKYDRAQHNRETASPYPQIKRATLQFKPTQRLMRLALPRQ